MRCTRPPTPIDKARRARWRGVRGGEVALKVRQLIGIGEVGGGRRRHQRARTVELDNLDQARIQAREKVARGVERRARRREDAPLVGCGVSFGGAQARAHRLGGHDHLGDAIAHVRQRHRVAGLGDSRRQAEDGTPPSRRSSRPPDASCGRRRRCRIQRVASRDVAAQEYALPRHQHVVEHDHRVHLVEARRERVVEARAAEVEASRHRNFRPGVAIDRERQRERRQPPAPAFNTVEESTSSSSESGASVASIRHPLTTMPSVVFSISLSARSASVCRFQPAARLARGIDQRMRRAPVVMAAPVHSNRTYCRRGADRCLKNSRAADRGETHVEVIRRAAEHPAAEVGPRFHHARALAQSSALSGLDEGHAARPPSRAVRHRLGMLDLHVVERRDRARAIGKRGMRGDVAGARAADPDSAPSFFSDET